MAIWKQKLTLEGLNALNKGTMGEAIGVEFTDYGEDYLEATIPVDHRTVQPMGLLHGGASVALAETLGSIAGVLVLEDTDQQAVVGIEINANHLRSARKGKVTGRVMPVRIGRSIQVWRITIRDEQERQICESRLTTMVIDR